MHQFMYMEKQPLDLGFNVPYMIAMHIIYEIYV